MAVAGYLQPHFFLAEGILIKLRKDLLFLEMLFFVQTEEKNAI